MILLLLLSILWFPVSVLAAGNESRCTALGANCIASEPLNTSSYTGGPDYWNAADTTTKEAANDGIAGAVVSNGGVLGGLGVNSGEAINALPVGHTTTFVFKQPDGGGGQALAHRFAATDPTALRALRFYRYYSADHVWTNDAGAAQCNSGKVIQIAETATLGGGPLIDYLVDNKVSFYNIILGYGYNPNQPECCAIAPGSVGVTLPTHAQARGRWWRFEFLFHNAEVGGTNTYWELYAKDISTSSPFNSGIEFKVIDTRIAQTSDGNPAAWWTGTLTTALHVTSQMRSFAINLFRSNNGDPCTGHIAHTHALWAAWDTDAGQRIDAAVEVEGIASTRNRARSGALRSTGGVTF